MCDHSTSDDASRYRSKEEVEAWAKKDPIDRLEKYMKNKGMLDDAYKAKVLENATNTVEKAVTEFEKITPPDPKDIFNYVYETLSPTEKEQMEEIFGK